MAELFGKLERVKDLRDYWNHEAHDFTPWLANHLDQLKDALGFSFKNSKTEYPVGSFSADIKAEARLIASSDTYQNVVIENQLQVSDHNHLGKIITYASGTDAQIVIWIVGFARKEHIKAIEWLNENSKADKKFFLVEIQLWKIENSKPAPWFNVVVHPYDWVNPQITSRESTDKKLDEQVEFWKAFISQGYKDGSNFWQIFKVKDKIDKGNSYHLGYRGHPKGLSMYAGLGLANDGHISIHVEIDKEFSKKYIDQTTTFQKVLGSQFGWDTHRKTRDLTTGIYKGPCDTTDRTKWPEYIKWLQETAVKFKDAFAAVDNS